jgi:serine-type D-Ala-D-Ala carboxypeptidase/endopeptidase (penicillin-binding protein 4)
MKKIFLLILAIGISAAGTASAKLPASLAKILKGYPNSEVSIYIQKLGSNTPLATLNPTAMRTPASVVKILTTYTALAKFGPKYRWKTSLYISGDIKDGVLDGDIMFKGYGDPGLINEDVEVMVETLKKRGIHTITGNLILDDSYFDVTQENSAMFDNNAYSPYNANPNALLLNHRASAITIHPDSKRGMILISKDIPDDSYSIVDKTSAHNGKCTGSIPAMQVKTNNVENATVTFLGKVSKHCRQATIYRVLTHPTHMFYATFKHMTTKHGIDFKGTMKHQKIPKNARALYAFRSRPLSTIIAATNKDSNNVMARQIMLTIGAHTYGAGVTKRKSATALLSYLKKQGILSKRALVVNGSGLSRTARLSVLGLARLLKVAYKKYGKTWMDTLAVMGTDGTLRRRMRKTGVRGNAWMKTGSLNNVRSIAGYVKSRSGALYIVVMMHNGKTAQSKGYRLQEQVINWVYRR